MWEGDRGACSGERLHRRGANAGEIPQRNLVDKHASPPTAFSLVAGKLHLVGHDMHAELFHLQGSRTPRRLFSPERHLIVRLSQGGIAIDLRRSPASPEVVHME